MVGMFRDTIVVKLEEKSLVVHLVGGLGKVEQDGVCLSSFIKLCCQVIHSQDELCLAGSSLMEAMLGVNQDVVVVKVRSYSCADYVFQKLPTYQC